MILGRKSGVEQFLPYTLNNEKSLESITSSRLKEFRPYEKRNKLVQDLSGRILILLII